MTNLKENTKMVFNGTQLAELTEGNFFNRLQRHTQLNNYKLEKLVQIDDDENTSYIDIYKDERGKVWGAYKFTRQNDGSTYIKYYVRNTNFMLNNDDINTTRRTIKINLY